MARINVEDDWFADLLERRATLIKRLANEAPVAEWMADGAALKAWRLAQRFWREGRKPIPEDVWARSGLEPLIECDLAVRQPDGSGVYVRGSKAHHDWLADWTEKSVEGGKKRSTGANRDPRGRFQPNAESVQPVAGEWLDSDGADPAIVQPSTLPLTLTLKDICKPASQTGRQKGGVEPFDQMTAEAWANHARQVIPHLRPKPDAWAKAVRDLRVLDKMTEAEITALLDWIKRDDFWRTNAVSPVGLRKPSRNGLRKIDNIRSRMNQGASPSAARGSASPAKLLTAGDLDDL